MRVRRARLLLWTASAALAVGAGVVVYTAVRDADAIEATLLPQRLVARLAPAAPSDDLPPLPELLALAARDLRRPLYDPPPAAAAPVTPPPPPAPPAFTVAGTAVESGHCRAILVTANGHVRIRGVGDTIEGALIRDVGRDSVTVVYNGRPFVLRVRRGRSADGSGD